MFALLVLGLMMVMMVFAPLMLLQNKADFDSRVEKANDLVWKISLLATIGMVTWFSMSAYS